MREQQQQQQKQQPQQQPNVSANEIWWTTKAATTTVNYEDFHNWLARQGKTKRTIKETVNYSKRFASVLDTRDASIILDTIKPETRHHVLSSLANLAKYTGRYEQFNQIRRNYNLKWTKTDSTKHFERFFN